MLFLSGGTGTPKLLRGVKTLLPPKNITTIVNTAEDTWESGNLVCPDIDTVLYLFSDQIDETKWWGVKQDTFHTHNALKKLGEREQMMVGDTDRATHISRSNLIRAGKNLTEATQILARQMHIKANILPMSNDSIATTLHTDKGWMHFQDFWIRENGLPQIKQVQIKGIERAKITENVRNAIESEDTIIIGPSNPVTSIGPILKLRGMKALLKDKKVIAISPIINNEPVSGPAGKLLSAEGYSVSSAGVAEYYGDILSLFVIDKQDNTSPEDFDVPVIKTDTMMTSIKKSIELAKKIIELQA
ncbi:MAG: LPPG:FO 2-phospho-L-lactate transferase [Candidatus Argoarchaeum ethanivorans]|uniref:2-phospho-L-lactate transferase n=1 Tax=Candidatus Argoarchaeum ethanivorans TaxID=2608793 RepID=A0A8B3S2Z3_9EURY|nr:MAG: LPPG:FO 2-phospho-L-lactate transferase [Candidatus Argoarchaeum ethanivorans]